MKFEVDLFPEVKDLEGIFDELKARQGKVSLNTTILDGMEEEKREEAEEQLKIILELCGKAVILAAECYRKTEDKSLFEQFIQQMVVKTRHLDEISTRCKM